jgi:hypothetical protein
MKRDNWTNEEVMTILKDLKAVGREGIDLNTDWNNALDYAIGQFWDFQKPLDEFAAMAYNPETKEIVVVGPPLPR